MLDKLIGAGVSLLGGLFGNKSSAKSAERANEISAQSARDQMKFQEIQNAKQMEFQERLSNTAHQRQVSDLRAAGLNPMLSGMGGSGASTPTGTSSAGASFQAQKADVKDVINPAYQAYLNTAYQTASIDKTEADTELTKAQTETEKTRPLNINASTGLIGAQHNVQQALSGLTTQQGINAGLDADLKDLEKQIKAFEITKQPLILKQIEDQLDVLAAAAQDARNSNEMSSTAFGQFLNNLNSISQSIQGLGNAASSARSLTSKK